MRELIGWTAPAILLMTIVSQIYKQWSVGTSKGVSMWLFIGQIAASAGFTWYSVLTGNAVFIVTNALMLLAGIIGLGMVLLHREKGKN